MSFKIDTNYDMKRSITVSSPGYEQAQQRFQDILQNKLNVKQTSKADLTSMANSNSNRLASNGRFNPTDVTERSGDSAGLINAKLSGTPMAGLGDAFKAAEDKYGVNAMFLAGLGIHESNYGKSRIATDKNNLFGFQAYDNSPYASAGSFSSMEECIDKVAQYLSENYLNPSGKYFNGYGVSDIGQRYATDPNWATAIENITNRF